MFLLEFSKKEASHFKLRNYEIRTVKGEVLSLATADNLQVLCSGCNQKNNKIKLTFNEINAYCCYLFKLSLKNLYGFSVFLCKILFPKIHPARFNEFASNTN